MQKYRKLEGEAETEGKTETQSEIPQFDFSKPETPKQAPAKNKGGRKSLTPFANLGKERKDQLVREAISAVRCVAGERWKEVLNAANKKANPGRTPMEEQMLQNISTLCREDKSEGNTGRRAAILTHNLDIPLKEANKITGVSLSMISKAKKRINQGIFRVTKVIIVIFPL